MPAHHCADCCIVLYSRTADGHGGRFAVPYADRCVVCAGARFPSAATLLPLPRGSVLLPLTRMFHVYVPAVVPFAGSLRFLPWTVVRTRWIRVAACHWSGFTPPHLTATDWDVTFFAFGRSRFLLVWLRLLRATRTDGLLLPPAADMYYSSMRRYL